MTAPSNAARRVQRQLHAVHQEYGESQPLGGYLAAMSVYGLTVGALTLLGRRLGASLPERLDWSDVALAGVATHKLARLLSKEPVTSPIRAPFTTFEGPTGDAELSEDVRG